MRVIVRFHEDCNADIRAWLTRLPGSIEDRRMMVRVVLEEVKRELARTAGWPDGTVLKEVPVPANYWWKISNTCWVRYKVTDAGSFLGGRTRTIEIIGLEAELPG
jgi:hypothetical protein